MSCACKQLRYVGPLPSKAGMRRTAPIYDKRKAGQLAGLFDFTDLLKTVAGGVVQGVASGGSLLDSAKQSLVQGVTSQLTSKLAAPKPLVGAVIPSLPPAPKPVAKPVLVAPLPAKAAGPSVAPVRSSATAGRSVPSVTTGKSNSGGKGALIAAGLALPLLFML